MAKKPRTAGSRLPFVPSSTALPGEVAGAAAVLIYTDPLVAGLFRLGIIHDLLDLGGQSVESLVHIDVVLGRDLEEWDSQLVGQCLALFGRHSALFLPVTFVANENLVDALARMLLDISEPCSDICRPRQ